MNPATHPTFITPVGGQLSNVLGDKSISPNRFLGALKLLALEMVISRYSKPVRYRLHVLITSWHPLGCPWKLVNGQIMVSKLVYNLFRGLTTYLYRGYNPFTKYHGHPSTEFIWCPVRNRAKQRKSHLGLFSETRTLKKKGSTGSPDRSEERLENGVARLILS